MIRVAQGELLAASPALLRERDELRDALREIIGQADAQFHAGLRHATFHRQTIDSFRNLLA